jgi:hypothetical protein
MRVFLAVVVVAFFTAPVFFADIGAIIIFRASVIGTQCIAISLKLQAPVAFVIDKHMHIPMPQVPAYVVIIAFACRFIDLKRDIPTALSITTTTIKMFEMFFHKRAS